MYFIFMNLGIFACIVSFDLRTGIDNIRDYAGLYHLSQKIKLLSRDI